MPLDYSPKDAGVWPEATYDAELMQVLDKTSKMKPDGSGGNAMQEWKVKVHRGDGATQLISDYFVPPGGTFKLKQLAKALDKEAEFEAGTFQADDHEGASFKVALIIEDGGDFGDKNKIKKYLPPNSKPPAPTIKEQIRSRRQPVTNPIGAGDEPQFKKDDIPF
jgi:hypothetical protein